MHKTWYNQIYRFIKRVTRTLRKTRAANLARLASGIIHQRSSTLFAIARACKCVVPQTLDVGLGLVPSRLVVNEDRAVGDKPLPYLRNDALRNTPDRCYRGEKLAFFGWHYSTIIWMGVWDEANLPYLARLLN